MRHMDEVLFLRFVTLFAIGFFSVKAESIGLLRGILYLFLSRFAFLFVLLGDDDYVVVAMDRN